LIASNRLRTRYNKPTNQVVLQINDVRPEDVGQYLVVATNPAGKDSTGASLSIIPEKPGIPVGEAPRPLEITPEKFGKLKPVPPSTKAGEEEVPEEKRPPRVIEKLGDVVIEELMPVILTTKIDAGIPMATVSVHCFSLWERNISLHFSSTKRKA
jgi:hypothetical protein